jgi:hypothetical protein
MSVPIEKLSVVTAIPAGSRRRLGASTPASPPAYAGGSARQHLHPRRLTPAARRINT